jgi:hypothetical protein
VIMVNWPSEIRLAIPSERSESRDLFVAQAERPLMIECCPPERLPTPSPPGPSAAGCNFCEVGCVLGYGSSETRPDECAGNSRIDRGDSPG